MVLIPLGFLAIGLLFVVAFGGIFALLGLAGGAIFVAVFVASGVQG